MFTFKVRWSISGERQRVWGDHQHCQFAEHQTKDSHDEAFFLSLVQEVGWTARSRTETLYNMHQTDNQSNLFMHLSTSHLKTLEDPLVNPWQRLFFLVRTARINTTTSYNGRWGLIRTSWTPHWGYNWITAHIGPEHELNISMLSPFCRVHLLPFVPLVTRTDCDVVWSCGIKRQKEILQLNVSFLSFFA